MDIFIMGLSAKMVMSVVMWSLVQFTPGAYADPAGPGVGFLGPLVLAMLVTEVASNLIFISIIAFFSKISDPSIGASYMTLLNTLTNLGSKWITSLSLYLLPKRTFYTCEAAGVSDGAGAGRAALPYTCTAHEMAVCTEHGGSCVIALVS
jgi:PAT family acetyl-CoA transporter-like MFS transporter 1